MTMISVETLKDAFVKALAEAIDEKRFALANDAVSLQGMAIFNDKLKRTGSLDQAFTKVIWCAFKAGVEVGREGIKGEQNASQN